MKVKDLLENYQGNSHIEIYDNFSWNTRRFNNKEIVLEIMVIIQCNHGWY